MCTKNREHDAGERPRYKIVFSVLAVLFVVLATPCQIALTVCDNHRLPRTHRVLLFLAMAGTTVHAVCTAVVFWGEMGVSAFGQEKESQGLGIRRRCVRGSVALLLVEVGLGVAFTVLVWGGWYRVGGIVEWVMAFTFTFYFWGFVGFLMREKEEGKGENGEVGERTALLG